MVSLSSVDTCIIPICTAEQRHRFCNLPKVVVLSRSSDIYNEKRSQHQVWPPTINVIMDRALSNWGSLHCSPLSSLVGIHQLQFIADSQCHLGRHFRPILSRQGDISLQASENRCLLDKPETHTWKNFKRQKEMASSSLPSRGKKRVGILHPRVCMLSNLTSLWLRSLQKGLQLDLRELYCEAKPVLGGTPFYALWLGCGEAYVHVFLYSKNLRWGQHRVVARIDARQLKI